MMGLLVKYHLQSMWKEEERKKERSICLLLTSKNEEGDSRGIFLHIIVEFG
jgi:hypothetical protein